MADEQRVDQRMPTEEVNSGQESNAASEPQTTPTQEDAAQDIEAEDRFEATDN